MSALGPINPSSVQNEDQKQAAWIVRKLAGSITGRIAISTYESLRATGTSVICLSPWGDSSPLLLPCIRFRDLAVHTVVACTGGTAAVAAPAMGPISDILTSSIDSSILVELGSHAAFSAVTWAGDELLIDKPLNKIIPVHEANLATTGIKTLTITLKYKHTVTDAQLGFFRSASHADPSLFASVGDYLAVEKGWFSPYLFASARRPIIPRTMKPDFVFCHGPFLEGDYRVGETLVRESAKVLHLCEIPEEKGGSLEAKEKSSFREKFRGANDKLTTLLNHRTKSHPASSTEPEPEPREQSPPPTLQPLSSLPPPRRLAILILGLKPHRLGLWTSSARPGESVLQYELLNGCPTIILPALPGSPLISWNTLTLKQLQAKGKGGYNGVLKIMFEYVSLCVDWERVIVGQSDEERKKAVCDALELVVAAAAVSGESKQVKKEVDAERAGIVVFRIP